MRRSNIWLPTAITSVLAAGVAFGQLVPGNFQGFLNEEGVRLQALGRVREVVDRDTFTIAAQGMTFRVFAPRNTVSGNQPIRQGDRIRIFGDLKANDRIHADQVQVLDRGRDNDDRGGKKQSRVVEGTLRDINRQERRMTVAVPAGNVRVQWDADTEFIRESRPSTLNNFRAGERVRVVGRRTGLNAIEARRIVFGGKAGWSNGAIGEVVSLDSRNREMEVDFDGEIWTVRVNNASFRRRGGGRAELRDLHLGQDVRITGTARGGRAVDATAVELVRDAR